MDPTTLAEQATLGTLLIDPTQIATVQGFLHPCDFLTVWHRHIYTTMLNRQKAAQPMTPQQVHADLVHAGHPDERTRAVRLVSLMEVPPARPNAARYGRMVLEASLRRQVAQLGLLLRAGAVSSAPRADSGPFAEIDAQLRDASRRWAAGSATSVDTSPAANVPDPDPDVTAAYRTEVALKAARLLDAAPPPHPDAIRRVELDVLAAVLADPEQLPAVRARISASMFTDPAHLATFAAICDLADLVQPIDAVTVSWHTQREHLLRGHGLDADVVLRLSLNPPAGDAAHAAATMTAQAARTIADRSAVQLAAAANHQGIDVGDLLDTARSHVAAVLRALPGPQLQRSADLPAPRRLQLVAIAAAPTRSAGRSL